MTNKKLLLNIILDGFGLGPQDETNAVHLAQTPHFDALLAGQPSTKLTAHGHAVGLPGENDLGGSEVGHLTLGAGNIFPQGLSLINKSLEDGSLFQQPAWREAKRYATKKSLHLIGLLSDGGVHSHINHLLAMLDDAAGSGVARCFVHVLLDGRDVGIQSAHIYIQQLEDKLKKIMQERPGFTYKIASGGGREQMTMDRVENWDNVQRGWRACVEGEAENRVGSALEAVERAREKNPEIIDQDIQGFVVVDAQGVSTKMQDGDAVVLFNFRGDRAIELTRAFVEQDFSGFIKTHKPQVYFAGMCIYDEDTNTPHNHIISVPSVPLPFGRRLVELQKKQFRLAETQKFPHVTFFFNGGYRLPLDASLETYTSIPSDCPADFALKPRMKAREIADKACEYIQEGSYDFGLINFANPDMLGHTGDMRAVIRGVEEVDACLGKILQALEQAGGMAIITADHGNADEMLITNAKGTQEISTKHSINPVPCIFFDPSRGSQIRINNLEKPGLANIAASNFVLMGLDVPEGLEPALVDFAPVP